MDYFKILNLRTEPFSNSPDPGFFYRSEQHVACLQRLELAIRLKRGLNVVIGDIGTGKTTLSRQFILQHRDEGELELHLLLDPSFNNSLEFLHHICGFFGLPADQSEWQLKENIKNYLFRKGVDEGKTIVIVIDEGQKLPEFSLEILREFMNYETNEFKLLQVIIFAQNEFKAVMEKHPNFADRVNFCSYLEPLSFKETRALINYRLKQASDTGRNPNLFTLPAYWSIFKLSGGRPRKIIQLCHKLLLSMIIQNRSRVNSRMVRACFYSTELPSGRSRKWAAVTIGSAILICAIFLTFNFGWQNKRPHQVQKQETITTVTPVSVKPSEAMVGSGGAVAPSNAEGKRSNILGKLKISRGETAGELISSVYGVSSARIYKAFSMANPQIQNLHRIEAGEELTFPLVEMETRIPDAVSYRIEYAEFNRLDKAYSELKKLRDRRVPVRMATLEDKSGQIKYALIGSSGYPNEALAQKAVSSFAPGAAVIDLKKYQTYYSDIK